MTEPDLAMTHCLDKAKEVVDRLHDRDSIQHLFTTNRTPSTLQDQEPFKSNWQVIRKYNCV